MKYGINYATAELQKVLVRNINASGLPAVNVRLILENLLQQAKEQEAKAIGQETEGKEEEKHGGQTDQ